MANNKGVKLRITEALQDDAYKGIARIDFDVMKTLGVKRGDIIKIKGNRESVAIADKAYPADVGEGIIRVDGIIRRNVGTGISENVTVQKAEVKEAKKIIVAPSQKGIMIQGDLKPGLLGRAVVKGDIVVLGGVRRRRDLMSEDLENLFGGLGDMFGDAFGGMGLGGLKQLRFMIVGTNPSRPCIITENTEVVLSSKPVDVKKDAMPDVTYEDIGGLTGEVKKIREMVEVPLKHPEIFEKLGVESPKGVLLHGPPGTGKTLLAKAVANESDANFVLLNGPEIMSKYYGESEKKIRELFDNAEKDSPSIVFIDEIDAIAPKREDVGGEVERRVVSQLLAMMDGLESRGKVIVIGATNRINAVDPALRRPGRFDRELELRAPSKEGRLQILKIHTRNMPLTKDVNLVNISNYTHGFVGADIAALSKEAAMVVLRRILPKLNLKEDEPISDDILKELKISKKEFDEALKVVRPSAMREVLVETPNINWEDVGGLEEIKQEIKEAVEWPLKYSKVFKRMGVRAPKGVLLYGPPGTGKTLLAKAVAKESEANFIQVKGPSLLSMWVGESEKGVRKIFERARQVAPCVIFFDEIDSLAGKRGQGTGSKVTERVLNQLLAEMDGIEDLSNIIVIGATNRPDMLDSALLRPGRFDKILLSSSPDKKSREQIFKIHTKGMPLASDVDIKKIIEKIEDYVGADIEAMVREAAMISLRENIDNEEVKMKHFEESIKKNSPSVTKSDMEKYKKIENEYLKSAKSALKNKVNAGYLG